jgi:hypothetical protein
MMPGDLGGAIQDAYFGVEGHQGQRPAHGLRRDGIVRCRGGTLRAVAMVPIFQGSA